MANKVCEVHWLGEMDYGQAWALQKRLADEIGDGKRPPTLLLLEHTPTFTFGRRGKASNLLWDQAELSRRGIQTHWVDRGGDITYHGPGQLVGYPLLPLQPGGLAAGGLPAGRLPQADYLGYLRGLERMLTQTLGQMGVSGRTIEGRTGVWVDMPDTSPTNPAKIAKIAAIGVKVNAKGVSLHGFALNVDPDMEPWQGIIPCGIEDCRVTCLAELVSPCPDMQEVRNQLVKAFCQVFNYDLGFRNKSRD